MRGTDVIMRKIRVGVLCGGRSAEHEVSLQSARNVIEAINPEKYEVLLIGIDKQGQWFLGDSARFLLNVDNPKLIALNRTNETLSLIPGATPDHLMRLSDHQSAGPVDVVFPVLHGPYGEDGTIQGLLKLADIPFVGAGVLGSAIGMDKDVMKRLLRDAGIPAARFLTFHRASRHRIDFEEVVRSLGLPCFVKPANMGSSVGISKAKNRQQFEDAVTDAFRYDHKILIEECIVGREIECAVLGNEDPIASICGEILPQHEFYSYEAKYIDENGALLEIPARLPAHQMARIQQMAIDSFRILNCEGMARADFFLKENGDILVNELNTIPGFTKISMYPKLWEASGIPYAALIDRLIQLALERFEQDRKLEN